jgi:hypothetical protein
MSTGCVFNIFPVSFNKGKGKLLYISAWASELFRSDGGGYMKDLMCKTSNKYRLPRFSFYMGIFIMNCPIQGVCGQNRNLYE